MRLYLLIISILLVCTGCLNTHQNPSPQKTQGLENPPLHSQKFLPQTARDFHMSYTFFGSTQAQIDFVDRTRGNIQVVSPSYFDINTDGSLKLTTQLTGQQNLAFINEMHRRNIKVVPFLSNHWDRNLGRAGLANREQLSTQIAQAIQTYNLDGVNVDIENVTHVDKDDFTDLVRLLRKKVPAHKEVSVAVATNPNRWTLGWHGMYDYKNLAQIADYLMLMAYDESYLGGEPGPVASLSWVEKGIVEVLKHAPANKVVLGLPFFGRYWQQGVAVGGHGIAKHMVDTLAQRYNGRITFDEASQSPRLDFTIRSGDPTTIVSGRTLQPGTYTLWFEDQKSLQGKFNLINKYSLAGSGSWALGLDNPVIWANYGRWMMASAVQPLKSILLGRQTMGVVTSTTANIMSEASHEAAKIGELKNENIVMIAGEAIDSSQATWSPIKLENGEVGYVVSDQVQLMNTRNLFGQNRYGTSVVISQEGWEQGSETVILGRGDISIDALPGSVLAAKLDAPLLLTRPQTLPSEVLEEIKRLGAKRVILLGGEVAISSQIQNTLEQNNISIQRIAGQNRFDTSVQIANLIGAEGEIILVTGQATSPDPLAIAPYAGLKQIPLLLTQTQSLPKEIRNFIKENNIKKVTIIGGPVAISDHIEHELKTLGVTTLERVSGSDRFRTSIEIAKRFSNELNSKDVYIASGHSFIDALPGSPLASRERAPIILTSTDFTPTSVRSWLRAEERMNQDSQIHFLGGSVVITPQSRAQILQELTNR